MIKEISDSFASLPDTSKAAIIAAIVTLVGTSAAAIVALIGVYVTHRGHERRFRRQLAHDAEQKKTERGMLLRKEVYLEAGEALATGLTVLARHVDLTVPQEKLAGEASSMQGALAKVSLIGSSAAVEAVSTFSNEFASSLLELSLARIQLLQKQANLKIFDDQIKTFGEERDRMMQLMKELNFAGDREPHRWQFVQRTFEFERDRVDKALAEQTALRIEFQTELLPYTQRCFDATLQVGKFLVPAVEAVRGELGLPFDADHYRRLVESTARRQSEAVREFIRGLEALKG